MENKEVIMSESDQQLLSKQEGSHLQAIILASIVGIATLLFIMVMVFLRRPLLLSLLEQWRFLAINLLLLAIISLTSRPPLASSQCDGRKDQEQESRDGSHQCEPMTNTPLEERKEPESGKQSPVVVVGGDCGGSGLVGDSGSVDEEVTEKHVEISKEEINERAEAFITMFRQHYLVSDSSYTRHKIHSQRVQHFINH